MIISIITWGIYLLSLYMIIFWLLVFLEGGAKEKRKKLKEFPFVSIAVPAYNEEKTIKETIQSLLDLDYPENKLEILAINDGSKDKTKDIIKQIAKKHKIVKLIDQKNQGKAAALNNALKIAKGEYFVCLDADSFVEKEALKKMLPHFDKNNVGAVLPRIVVKTKSSLIRKIQWCEYILTFFYKKLMGELDCIHVTPGPFAIYKKDVIKKLGGFDKGNMTEDMEMALRLQKNNYKINQTLDVKVTTVAPKNFKEFYKQRNRWYKGSMINVFRYKEMLFNKRYGEFGLMQMPMIIIAAIISVVAFTIISYHSFLKPLFLRISEISSNLSFTTMMSSFLSNFHILDLNFGKLFFLYVLLSLSLIFTFLAFRSVKEPLVREGVTHLIAFIFLYPFLVFIVWCGVLFDFVTRRIQKW